MRSLFTATTYVKLDWHNRCKCAQKPLQICKWDYFGTFPKGNGKTRKGGKTATPHDWLSFHTDAMWPRAVT